MSGPGPGASLARLAPVFFAWGLTSVTIDMAVPLLKEAFGASYTQALLVQSAFFLAYLLFGRMAGGAAGRMGLGRSLAAGLGLMAAGCFLAASATSLRSFAAILPPVFLIASGITLLQVSANPLAAEGATPSRAASRLTLFQSFNSLGTLTAPFLAGAVLATVGTAGLASARALFVSVGALLTVLAVSRLRMAGAGVPGIDEGEASPLPRSVIFGAASIFLYVGAEVAIGSTLINLLTDERTLGASAPAAASLVSLYWGGAFAGRLVGIALLARLAGPLVLRGCAGTAATLALLVTWQDGAVAGAAALAIGLFNGVQFPAIFGLTVAGLTGAAKARASGWLCTAIVGGGVVPLLFGQVADRADLQAAFLVPAACYALIALLATRLSGRGAARPAAA